MGGSLAGRTALVVLVTVVLAAFLIGVREKLWGQGGGDYAHALDDAGVPDAGP